MPPPYLPGDAPVLDVLHPVIVDLLQALGDYLYLFLAHGLNGRLCHTLHLHEPLGGNSRLHRGVAAVAGAHVMLYGLHLQKIAALLQVLDYLFAGLHHAEPLVLSAVLVDVAGPVHNCDDRQVMPLAHQKVVGVVCGGYLHNAGAEVHLHVLVGYNGYHQRQYHLLADYILITLVLRVHGKGRIPQHGLRAGGGQLHIARAVGQGVLQMPETAVLFLELHLRVRESRAAVGTVVGHALAPIYKPLLIELYEHVAHRFRAALVQSEPLPVPVRRAAQKLQLLDYPSAVLVVPGPGPLHKAVPAQVLLLYALLGHGLHYLHLGGQGRVVRAGQP